MKNKEHTTENNTRYIALVEENRECFDTKNDLWLDRGDFLLYIDAYFTEENIISLLSLGINLRDTHNIDEIINLKHPRYAINDKLIEATENALPELKLLVSDLTIIELKVLLAEIFQIYEPLDTNVDYGDNNCSEEQFNDWNDNYIYTDFAYCVFAELNERLICDYCPELYDQILSLDIFDLDEIVQSIQLKIMIRKQNSGVTFNDVANYVHDALASESAQSQV